MEKVWGRAVAYGQALSRERRKEEKQQKCVWAILHSGVTAAGAWGGRRSRLEMCVKAKPFQNGCIH